MSGVRALLEKSGYSERAIEYYEKMLNVGEIEDPDAHFAYTGPCGDTMEMFLRIESNIITDAKFRAIGCAGSYASASALTEMIKGKTVEEAAKLDEQDILSHLGEIPAPKNPLHLPSEKDPPESYQTVQRKETIGNSANL